MGKRHSHWVKIWAAPAILRIFHHGSWGYILGVEWEDTTVAFTDHMKDTSNSYQGKYMYTSSEASPFEAMLAQVGDKIIDYESSKYKNQRLVAFANWPTTDTWSGTIWWNIISGNLSKWMWSI